MSRPQQIYDFITANHPKPVCNRCIAEGIGLTNKTAHPAQITGAFAVTSDFAQNKDRCSICTDTKLVIRRD